MSFKHFRKYCVFFDIVSKHHLINHSYRIDFLEKFNCYDFTSYSYELCYCSRSVGNTCTGFLLCIKDDFIERRKYVNYKNEKSHHMKQLYEKHSSLSEANNFYDNRINNYYMEKIKAFEQLTQLKNVEKKTMRSLHKFMYKSPPNIDVCVKCKNILNTSFPHWKAVRYINCLNVNNLCDHVLYLDDFYLKPNYTEECDDDTRIIVYKTTKANIVFMLDHTFYILNSTNMIIIFEVEIFKKVKFFCNFNFYFVSQTKTCNNNNFININNN